MVWQGLYLYAGEEALHGPVETVRDTAKLLATHLFWSHFSETAKAFAFALTIAVCGGISLGVWLGFHRASGELFVPMLIGFASIPKVVLYPLVLLAFGLGLSAKVAFGAMFGIPPIALSTIGAVAQHSPGADQAWARVGPGLARDGAGRAGAGSAAGDHDRPAPRILRHADRHHPGRDVRRAAGPRIPAYDRDRTARRHADHVADVCADHAGRLRERRTADRGSAPETAVLTRERHRC